MKVLVALEHRFQRQGDGTIRSSQGRNYAFWSRYLEAFDEVLVLARVVPAAEPPGEGDRADGPGVEFCALPDYRGPWGYLRRLPELKARVREAVPACNAYILRVPGLVGRLAWQEVKRLRRPYALEVLGDPWELFGPGTVSSVLRPIFRRLATAELAVMCRGAAAAAYVTQEALQRRYAPGKNAYSTSYSSVELGGAFPEEEKLRERLRRLKELEPAPGARGRPLSLGFVGSFAQPYKGVDTLLAATARCRRRGMNLEVSLVGDGLYRPAMEDLAVRLAVAKQVRFLGQLPSGAPIYEFLDAIDLFVLPSRSEGLPRALLEAIARGCPCLGTRVGGVEELLPADALVPPGDPEALAAAIHRLAQNPGRMAEMARRNLEKARDYSPEVLGERRRSFYAYVRGLAMADDHRLCASADGTPGVQPLSAGKGTEHSRR